MSEKLHSNDPVVDALRLEGEIAHTLQHAPDNKARSEVRAKMEQWMELMHDSKAARQYSEELGELPVQVAEQDVLHQISMRFPKIAKELGWNPDAAEQHNELAA